VRIQRDAFLNTVIRTTHLISPDEGLFSSSHIKIVATADSVRSFCSGHEISACAYVPVEDAEVTPGTYYFARAALEAFATKLSTDSVTITKIGNRNILTADSRKMEFLDPKKNYAFPRKPTSDLENLDTLSDSDAMTIQTVAPSAGTGSQVQPQYHCVYALPVEHGTEIYAYNGASLAMGVLDKKFKRAVALPVPLARMAKFGNLLVSAEEVGIEGPFCLYWCKAPVMAQQNFPIAKVQHTLSKPGTKMFEIDGKDMTAAVDLLQRAFASWDEASDATLILEGNTLKVRVRFPSTAFQEEIEVRGVGSREKLRLPLKQHARLLTALARQPILHVYNVDKHVRFDGDGFKLLLPLELTK
jgi:hypothetical protein